MRQSVWMGAVGLLIFAGWGLRHRMYDAFRTKEQVRERPTPDHVVILTWDPAECFQCSQRITETVRTLPGVCGVSRDPEHPHTRMLVAFASDFIQVRDILSTLQAQGIPCRMVRLIRIRKPLFSRLSGIGCC